ncbi:MAG: helix-turn-helix domain-containing protein [Defluviitaleaceae bacterium]|nr:helix-turn-helix domain-containing protein [Defluviitaleaceae bacterium]
MDREKAKHAKNELDRIIGKNVRREREIRNMSRDELAEIIDLTTSHMGLIERGERGATGVTLMKLSHVLDRPIDDFFYEHKDRPSLREGSNEDKFEANRKRLASLFAYLTEKEQHFALHVIKELIRLNHSNTTPNDIGEEAEETEA